MTAYRIEDLPQRMAQRIAVNPETGCWEWQGARNRYGYGQVRQGRKIRSVHRVVYELLARPIPDGLHLDHVHTWGCRSRACCWPAHLEPVTNAENRRRAGLLVTHCPANHEYTEANTYTPPGGGKQCRACRNGERPGWTTVLVCPACGHSRTGPRGRFCGSCRCVSVNTHGKRCGNPAVASGRCDYHVAGPTEVGALLPGAKPPLTRDDAA